MTITYTTGRDPGDEQATRREFGAWAVLSRDGKELIGAFEGLFEAALIMPPGGRAVRCRVTIEEG